jgi:cobyrinic acid a,c-diamide synthase
MAHLFISAAHKSSGKTTVALGLCAALRRRELAVQPFKKGPDYIDPMWLTLAAGSPCHNLDFYTMERDEILTTASTFIEKADIGIIEGNKGLYDGLDLDGSNSNAALASLLRAPVILVLDARGMTRGIAPLILGYQAFDRSVNIAGVILNQLGGSRHEAKLRAVIEHYTDVPVVGAMARSRNLEIVERHLGLIPSNESAGATERIAVIGQAVADQVDLDKLLDIGRRAPLPQGTETSIEDASHRHDITIGIARDSAFGFYYPDDLLALERAGAELVPFNTLTDSTLPRVDALFIGGGFPETRMAELERNSALRRAIRDAIEAGLPAYAECGGLMYLARSLTWRGERREMVGVIDADIIMHERPQGRGYVRLSETRDSLWPRPEGTANEIAAHEFHYSSLENLNAGGRFAYHVKRGSGIDGIHDGLIYKNLLACYAHQRDTRQNRWTNRFVNYTRQIKNFSRSNATVSS